jgi:lysophospholipase L1-like esterase
MDRTWFPDKGYVPRLDDLIKSLAEDFHVINRGVPGEMTAEGLARIEQEISTYKAKYQLIMEGTNDMSGGVSSQVAAFNIEEMIIACLQKGVFPLLGTIIPRADSFWDGSIRQNTLLFNDLLRDISSRLKIPLADHYQIFMDYPAGYLSLFSDGAHPNELGYQQIAEAWFESINRIPWPPVNLTVERKINKILFYDESVNNLEWEENPLLAAGTQIARYSIHKKLKEENDSSFVIVATVAGSSLSYLDRDVSSDLVYSYFICAEDESGMKGPPSSTVHDR